MHTNNKKNSNKQKKSTKGKKNCLDDLDQIANEVDMICRLRLRDGAIKYGPLAGMESAIRQQTLIKVIGGFLQRNPDYIKARKSDNESTVHAAMTKCVAIAMRYCKAQIAEELIDHLSGCTELNENNGGICQHPLLLNPSDWPTGVKASVVMISVSRAVSEGSLSAANAGIVDMVCVQGIRRSEVARMLGIKPPAVSQQLRRVKKVLPEVMERVEVSWDY
jgi:hypothetical protein